MVEKNSICPTCREENVSIEEYGVSWKDLQGLTWLFCENCSNQTMDEIQKKIISYAQISSSYFLFLGKIKSRLKSYKDFLEVVLSISACSLQPKKFDLFSMKEMLGLFVASILLAGALVAPINYADAHDDDDDDIEDIEEFDDGVVLYYSSTTVSDIREKIKQVKMKFFAGLKDLRGDFRIGLMDLIEQYREDGDKQAFKDGFKQLKNETKIAFKELRHAYKQELKEIKKFVKMELPKDDRKEIKKKLKESDKKSKKKFQELKKEIKKKFKEVKKEAKNKIKDSDKKSKKIENYEKKIKKYEKKIKELKKKFKKFKDKHDDDDD